MIRRLVLTWALLRCAVWSRLFDLSSVAYGRALDDMIALREGR